MWGEGGGKLKGRKEWEEKIGLLGSEVSMGCGEKVVVWEVEIVGE